MLQLFRKNMAYQKSELFLPALQIENGAQVWKIYLENLGNRGMMM